MYDLWSLLQRVAWGGVLLMGRRANARVYQNHVQKGLPLYCAAYVLPVSRLTPPYLIAIEPLRRFILSPVMLRRLRRWRSVGGVVALVWSLSLAGAT